ncbi:MAG: hypothetical protein LC799_31570, partial [Actinobacteria bacterium]|nr:hypothetical protein [Actinomycetota bacterium]
MLVGLMWSTVLVAPAKAQTASMTLRSAVAELAVAEENRLVTVGNDRRLNLLNLGTGRYERHLDVESAPIWAVAFSPSGRSWP